MDKSLDGYEWEYQRPKNPKLPTHIIFLANFPFEYFLPLESQLSSISNEKQNNSYDLEFNLRSEIYVFFSQFGNIQEISFSKSVKKVNQKKRNKSDTFEQNEIDENEKSSSPTISELIQEKKFSQLVLFVVCENISTSTTIQSKLNENLFQYLKINKSQEIKKTRVYIEFSQRKKKQVHPIRSIPCTSSTSHIQIPGLFIIEDFLTEDEEKGILSQTNLLPWWNPTKDTSSTPTQEINLQSHKHTHTLLMKRRVQHFGYEFKYDILNVDLSSPLTDFYSFPPPFLYELTNRISSLTSSLSLTDNSGKPWYPDQLTINEYNPGQGLAAHVDTHSAFEDIIVLVSLGSRCVMEFIRDPQYNSNTDQKENECESTQDQIKFDEKRKEIYKYVTLPRRSVCILSEESRYLWAHYIPQRKYDNIDGEISKRDTRVSLTFRKVLITKNCVCNFGSQCDSQNYISKQTH